MPLGQLTLKTGKPKPYPEHPKTLGDHIRRRRIELGLAQREVATRCGVASWTVHTWETNKAEPAVRRYPLIMSFLGYDPFSPPQTAGERLVTWRRQLGLSRKRAAKILGLDEMKLARWERGEDEPSEHDVARIEAFLAGRQ